MNTVWLEQRYQSLLKTKGDIDEHLPFLRLLAAECDTVSELGTQCGVSTTALILGANKLVTSCDHLQWGDVAEQVRNIRLLQENSGTKFQFIHSDSRKQEAVPGTCDLLFIDTYHNYGHLSAELAAHGHKATKYLVFHDTVVFGETGDNSTGGLLKAINEYRQMHPEWVVKHDFKHQYGLLVLGKL